MARRKVEITLNSEDPARIPDNLVEGATMLLDLERRGVLDQIGERLKIRRQGGYCGLDVWIVLWLFVSSGATSGVKKFWEVLRPFQKRVAAMAGRRKLSSPASLSRALGAIEPELLREASQWLLLDVADIDDVLRHPAMQTYDAHGRNWHVFDLDPSVVTLRHRSLPVDDGLPEVRRRSEDTGAPGYSGRKRGDIQFRQISMNHAGSSAWIHSHLSTGNGDGVIDFDPVLDSLIATSERLEHPVERTLLRMDGEYGNVPFFSLCRERGVPFITRLNRPKLFDDPEILARLRGAMWNLVEDSKCGPQRSAADIGMISIAPGAKTMRPDGTTYEPVTLRVVACIFPKRGKAKRGRTLDGWQVELFAADLPADAWRAHEVITAYYARNSLENRIGQGDRELGIDRVVSYHLPGQELATLVGLSLWNLRLARGFEMERPPEVRPAQRLHKSRVDDRVPAAWPRDHVARDALADLDWPELLARRSGWSWDRATGELRCDQDRPLRLTTVRSAPHAEGRTAIIFRRPTGGCEQCASRPDCLHTDRENASKQAEFSVPTEIAAKLRERLAAVRGRSGERPTIEPIIEPAGPLSVTDSLFLPAEARHLFTRTFLAATLRVEVALPPPEPRLRLVADDVGDRQRRRKTWRQNVDRYALPPGARVQVDLSGSLALRTMLGHTQAKTSVGGSS